METVTITVEELETLKKDQYFLLCLQWEGVDNWEGYEFACEEFNKKFPKE